MAKTKTKAEPRPQSKPSIVDVLTSGPTRTYRYAFDDATLADIAQVCEADPQHRLYPAHTVAKILKTRHGIPLSIFAIARRLRESHGWG